METGLLQARFYATYGYASAVRNILYDQFSYLRELEGFYCDDQYLECAAPFRPRSAFHRFIAYVIDSIARIEFADVDLGRRQRELAAFASIPVALEELKPGLLPVEEAFAAHEIDYVAFASVLKEKGRTFATATEEDLDEYLQETWLSTEWGELLDQLTDEVFLILFQNRSLLLVFNEMLSGHIRQTVVAELDEPFRKWFRADGVLGRVGIPKWVRRAVFFRDRGRCVMCGSDLSGILSLRSGEHFDHIVPLALGGLNDVCNLQLLCSSCNLKKSSRRGATSNRYEPWYRIRST